MSVITVFPAIVVLTTAAHAQGNEASLPPAAIPPIPAAHRPEEVADENFHAAENEARRAAQRDPSQHDQHGEETSEEVHQPLGHRLARISVLPFILLLLAIAVLPLASPHWWEHNSSKAIVVAVLSIPIALYLSAFGEAGLHELEHKGKEYVSFLLLLGSLFVISGGVFVRGQFRGTPVVNTIMLAIGTAIASFVGTTGASMLMIRPLIRANDCRKKVVHTMVFLIFLVSNCGGLLTPLGDPPLFLGFLYGVPFAWTLKLWPQWLFVNGLLLMIYFAWDVILYRGEPARSHHADEAAESIRTSVADEASVSAETLDVEAIKAGAEERRIEELMQDREPDSFGLEGWHNLFFLAGVVIVIYAGGQGIGTGGKPWPWGRQDVLMLLLMIGSYLLTGRSLREKNRFRFGPILEVAIIFAGIFVTMIPALAILNVEGKNLGLSQDWHYFWATGLLSSFLDNAPTYLTFAATAAGTVGIPAEGQYLRDFLASGGNAVGILVAISCGSVFMGANTYIGNGPNFMVKAIAEENNIRMPTFFGYLIYSFGILVPIFVVLTWIFI